MSSHHIDDWNLGSADNEPGQPVAPFDAWVDNDGNDHRATLRYEQPVRMPGLAYTDTFPRYTIAPLYWCLKCAADVSYYGFPELESAKMISVLHGRL